MLVDGSTVVEIATSFGDVLQLLKQRDGPVLAGVVRAAPFRAVSLAG